MPDERVRCGLARSYIASIALGSWNSAKMTAPEMSSSSSQVGLTSVTARRPSPLGASGNASGSASEPVNGSLDSKRTAALRQLLARRRHRPLGDAGHGLHLLLPRVDLVERVAIAQAAVDHHRADRVGVADVLERVRVEH